MFWATLGCRIIGALLVGLGVAGLVASWRSVVAVQFAVVLAIVLTTGSAYLAAGHYVARRRAWAGICGIVLACLTLLVMLGITAITVMLYMWLFNGGPDHVGFPVALTIEAAILAGLIWLIVQLWRSVRSIQRAATGARHGFAVLPMAVLPVEPEATE